MLALSLIASAFASHAAEDPASTHVTVFAGFEIGDNDSRRIDAGALVQFMQAWSANAAVTRSNFELPGVSATSTSASAKVARTIGAVSVGAGVRRGEIENVSRSRAWFATAAFDHRELRFGLDIEARDTRLDPAAFTEDLGAGIGIVSGISRCRVDGIGYQGRVDLDRPTWSLYGSLRVYDYDDYDCILDITAGGPPGNEPPPRARGRALGRRLAAASIDQVIGATSRLVPRESALLDSSAALGLTLPVGGQWIGGLELYRDVERLDGSDYLTAAAFAGRRLNSTWRAEFTLGYSTADLIDDTAFAGVRVTAAL
jgi:hypothetical protein